MLMGISADAVTGSQGITKVIRIHFFEHRECPTIQPTVRAMDWKKLILMCSNQILHNTSACVWRAFNVFPVKAVYGIT